MEEHQGFEQVFQQEFLNAGHGQDIFLPHLVLAGATPRKE